MCVTEFDEDPCSNHADHGIEEEIIEYKTDHDDGANFSPRKCDEYGVKSSNGQDAVFEDAHNH